MGLETRSGLKRQREIGTVGKKGKRTSKKRENSLKPHKIKRKTHGKGHPFTPGNTSKRGPHTQFGKRSPEKQEVEGRTVGDDNGEKGASPG